MTDRWIDFLLFNIGKVYFININIRIYNSMDTLTILCSKTYIYYRNVIEMRYDTALDQWCKSNYRI